MRRSLTCIRRTAATIDDGRDKREVADAVSAIRLQNWPLVIWKDMGKPKIMYKVRTLVRHSP